MIISKCETKFSGSKMINSAFKMITSMMMKIISAAEIIIAVGNTMVFGTQIIISEAKKMLSVAQKMLFVARTAIRRGDVEESRSSAGLRMRSDCREEAGCLITPLCPLFAGRVAAGGRNKGSPADF